MTKKSRISWKIPGMAGLSFLFAAIFLALPAAATEYGVTNLVADVPGLANFTDANLRNPWGITQGPTSPFWVSDNLTGVATLYNGAGQPFPAANPLVVTIPGGGPTGAVFNSTADFAGNRFLFATADGTIAGWSSGTTATLVQTVAGAAYTGLALGNSGGGSFLYAANFAAGRIDVFDGNFGPTLSGSFLDPNLPAGYSPFNVQNIGGSLLVTYRPANVGAGLGIVDVFDLNGNLIRRLITGGALNAPWGLALASAQFGEFSNDLLVANFGDGRINAFNPMTGDFLGTLLDGNGSPIAIDGLRGLIFGNGGVNGGDPDTLFFTAGLGGGQHGLLGSVAPVPAPSTMLLFGSGLGGLLAFYRMRRKA